MFAWNSYGRSIVRERALQMASDFVLGALVTSTYRRVRLSPSRPAALRETFGVPRRRRCRRELLLVGSNAAGFGLLRDHAAASQSQLEGETEEGVHGNAFCFFLQQPQCIGEFLPEAGSSPSFASPLRFLCRRVRGGTDERCFSFRRLRPVDIVRHIPDIQRAFHGEQGMAFESRGQSRRRYR